MAKGDNCGNDELHTMLYEYLSIHVTRQELDAPNLGLVTRVMHAVFASLGLNEAALEMPHTLLEADAVHIEGSVQLLNYLALMQQVFHPLGIKDVGLSDLINPKPKRTTRLFKILLNNWLRITGVYTDYKEREQRLLRAKAKTDEVRAELDATTARVNKLATSSGSSTAKKRTTSDELAACEKILAAHGEKKAAIVADYQQLKSTLCASLEALQRAKLDLGDLQQTLEETRAAVCKDPAAWKDKMAARTETLATLESEREQLRAAVSIVEEKIALAPRIKEAFQATLDSVAQMKAQRAKLEALQQEKAVQEKKRVELEQAHCTLDIKLKVACEELARLDLKVGGQPRDGDVGLQHRERRNSNVKKRLVELRAGHKQATVSIHTQVAELDAATDRLKEEIKATREATQEYVDKNGRKIDSLVKNMCSVAALFQETYDPNQLPDL